MIATQKTSPASVQDFSCYQPSKLPLKFIKAQARIPVQKAHMAQPTATDQNGNTGLWDFKLTILLAELE